MKMIFLLTIMTLSTLTLAQEKKKKDVVVAEVNDTQIMLSTLLAYHEQNLKVVRGNKTIDLDSSLNDLVDRAIGIDNGRKNKIDKRSDVVKKMNDIIYHAHISDELAPKFSKIKVKSKDIEKYYASNSEYRSSQILLRLRALPSQEEVSSALELSLKLYNQLQKEPKSFAKLAGKYSQITTSQAGGDIGYQPRVRLSKEYYEAIKGRRIGYITKPFRTQYGIHIVKVTGLKKYKQIDEKLYQKIVYDVKRDKILSDYFAGERKKSNLKVYRKRLNLK